MPRDDLMETIAKSLFGYGKGYMAGGETYRDLKSKIMMKQIEDIITPKKWEPRTREEAMEFEREKTLLKEEAWEKRERKKGKIKAEIKAEEPPKPEKLPTKQASQIAQKRLLREFLGQQLVATPETRGVERLPFVRSKRELLEAFTKGKRDPRFLTEKGKFSVRKLFDQLGITMEDWKNFAFENFPDEAKIAFPERRKLLGR